MAFEAWSAPNKVTKRKARAYSGFQALCDSTGTVPDMVQCTALLVQLEGRREVSMATCSYGQRENSLTGSSVFRMWGEKQAWEKPRIPSCGSTG